MNKVKPVPEGHHTVTTSIVVKDVRKAIEYYKKAFGATLAHELCEMPDGKIGHAEMQIGDTRVMMCDEFPEWGHVAPQGEAASFSLYVYVDDCDKVFKAALAAGGKQLMPMADQFWGDRLGQLRDPFGHRWSVATHKEDLTPEQMKKRQEEFFAAAAK